MDSSGKSESPGKFALRFSPLQEQILQLLISVFHGFCDEVYDFVEYFVHFQTFYYPRLRDHIIGLFVVNHFFL